MKSGELLHLKGKNGSGHEYLYSEDLFITFKDNFIIEEGNIYIVCLSGKRSAMAAQILRSNGMDAVNVKGGMLAWNSLD